MGKMPNQKLKLLYLRDYLLRETDEEHGTTVKRIIDYLESIGISCERKTVYSDIEELKKYGMDIICEKGKQTTYFVGSRDFQLTELRLLLDAVTVSKFLTPKKSHELTGKLMELCSMHERAWLRSRVYNADDLKNPHELIYQAMFFLHQAAISKNVVSFKYWTYNIEKERQYKNGGRPYVVEPYILTYNNGNYYLVGRDTKADKLKTFRIEKIDKWKLLDETFEPLYNDNELTAFIREQFSMFDGNTTEVELEFDEGIIGVIVDMFGKDVPIIKQKNGKPKVRTKIKASAWFYSWLVGLGNQIKIISPPSVKEEYVKHLTDIIDCYK